ncbi:bifunctional folylpolyglutamate synthase/dihydrofolate synthase [Xiamenia xianingshaonis]|uniref:tetrahydrofolate synthase n=1 Tax=Xiamenia xianingshaonis TaxID=2682776 RepID=A0A9E6SU22_9ACTN|nr:folylpolyglutamate synthase/dihydrofolate synthase family protein [Xiamenia xianingshaonis]NHM14892.1 bifunctional folylpolyglutamate synthase/dihydrofolate synthase [Xiamenia xianingshaonis]QTU84055.1 bifunctional folylpolyglutamate synthase/dihydrofolate synthase [Xiamenia xianingshaonis]
MNDTTFDAVAYLNEPRWRTSRLGLERIRALMEALGHPERRLRFVHVAGTNGKGSTCAYLASMLQAAGHRVGMFTSPYIERFEERIQLNGVPISPDDLRRVTLAVRDAAEAVAAATGDHPTEFELMTAVAFTYFDQEQCDLVVAEVGLGGRLDSTNVIERPETAVITRIGLDHTDVLGDTLAAVAGEKAGIVKPGSPVVSWPQEPEAMEVVEAAARRTGCELYVANFSEGDVLPVAGATRPFSYRGERYETALLGSYQPYNAMVALEAVQVLRERGWRLPHEAVRRGIAEARWPGRFEVLPSGGAAGTPAPPESGDAGAPASPGLAASGGSTGPVCIVDGGHNEQGAQALADSLRSVFPGRPVVFIMGVLADKDCPAMVRAVLPLAKAVVAVTPPNPRALSADDLAACVRQLDENAAVRVAVAESYGDAAAQARAMTADSDVICAFGSLYAVSAVKEALVGRS